MPKQYIKIRGANEHNLKNIDVDIPRDEFVVLTGLSGSGKSSLAFDTLYAEGQRRYVESLSSYARQFLGRMSKPECDFIKGIPPAIAIEQKVNSRNPRSTVGTSTEIYEYLRLCKNFRAVTICSAVLSVSCAFVGIVASVLAGTPVGSTIVAVDMAAFGLCCLAGKLLGRAS